MRQINAAPQQYVLLPDRLQGVSWSGTPLSRGFACAGAGAIGRTVRSRKVSDIESDASERSRTLAGMSVFDMGIAAMFVRHG